LGENQIVMGMENLSKSNGNGNCKSRSTFNSEQQIGRRSSSPFKQETSKTFLIFRVLLVWGFLFPVQGANAEAIWVYVQSQYLQAENEVVLSWDVLKAENPGFVVERSINGADNFQPVGTVSYKDSNRGEFIFVDRLLPLEGCAVYYRVLLVNHGQTVGSSDLAMVRVEGTKRLTNHSWRVFPNPITNGQVKVSPVENLSLEEVSLRLLILDQYNSRWEIESRSVLEMNIRLGNLLPELPKGILIFQIEKGLELERIKIINR
jgi:hypothetical protein